MEKEKLCTMQNGNSIAHCQPSCYMQREMQVWNVLKEVGAKSNNKICANKGHLPLKREPLMFLNEEPLLFLNKETLLFLNEEP